MRFLVYATPRIPPPPERMPAMIDAAEEWQERHSDVLQDFGLFPGGGGFGIVDVPDEATLHSMLAQMPFLPFTNVEVKVVVDSATGWQAVREAVAAMAEA